MNRKIPLPCPRQMIRTLVYIVVMDKKHGVASKLNAKKKPEIENLTPKHVFPQIFLLFH
jgi:hypothetical protein